MIRLIFYFTKRFLVVENKVAMAAQVKQPFSSQSFRTDQRIQVMVNTANARINTMSPQDLKVVVLQNNIWPLGSLSEPTNHLPGQLF